MRSMTLLAVFSEVTSFFFLAFTFTAIRGIAIFSIFVFMSFFVDLRYSNFVQVLFLFIFLFLIRLSFSQVIHIFIVHLDVVMVHVSLMMVLVAVFSKFIKNSLFTLMLGGFFYRMRLSFALMISGFFFRMRLSLALMLS